MGIFYWIYLWYAHRAPTLTTQWASMRVCHVSYIGVAYVARPRCVHFYGQNLRQLIWFPICWMSEGKSPLPKMFLLSWKIGPVICQTKASKSYSERFNFNIRFNLGGRRLSQKWKMSHYSKFQVNIIALQSCLDLETDCILNALQAWIGNIAHIFCPMFCPC